MSESKMISKVEEGRVLVLERVFDAPRSLVFQMYKEPDHLKHWWGPRGWKLPVCKMDFRESGVWHYCMKCVDKGQGDYFGMEAWGKATYEEIVEPERIVFKDAFSDADGNISDQMPSSRVVVQFQDLDGKTKLVTRSEYASAEALKAVMDMGMLEGITQTWDRLEERVNEVQ